VLKFVAKGEGATGKGEEKNDAFPFCSERCRLIDLSRWLNEDYRIPGPPEADVPMTQEDSADEAEGDPEMDLRSSYGTH